MCSYTIVLCIIVQYSGFEDIGNFDVLPLQCLDRPHNTHTYVNDKAVAHAHNRSAIVRAGAGGRYLLHSETFGVGSLFFQHDHVACRVSLGPSTFVWVDRRWTSNPW